MPDFAITDLVLAIAHHILVFALFGVLAFEIGMLRTGLDAAQIRRLARVDMHYGALAGLVVIVGFCRAVFAAKGWAYYSHNAFFWAKIAVFVLVGLISIIPSRAILRWRKAPPAEGEVGRMRKLMWLQAFLFIFVVAFAAAMARGYGAP